MTRAELLEKVLSGWFAIVGEFRGWNASSMGHLDRKTGLASKRVVLTFVVEDHELCWGEVAFLPVVDVLF